MTSDTVETVNEIRFISLLLATLVVWIIPRTDH